MRRSPNKIFLVRFLAWEWPPCALLTLPTVSSQPEAVFCSPYSMWGYLHADQGKNRVIAATWHWNHSNHPQYKMDTQHPGNINRRKRPNWLQNASDGGTIWAVWTPSIFQAPQSDICTGEGESKSRSYMKLPLQLPISKIETSTYQRASRKSLMRHTC